MGYLLWVIKWLKCHEENIKTIYREVEKPDQGHMRKMQFQVWLQSPYSAVQTNFSQLPLAKTMLSMLEASLDNNASVSQTLEFFFPFSSLPPHHHLRPSSFPPPATVQSFQSTLNFEPRAVFLNQDFPLMPSLEFLWSPPTPTPPPSLCICSKHT